MLRHDFLSVRSYDIKCIINQKIMRVVLLQKTTQTSIAPLLFYLEKNSNL